MDRQAVKSHLRDHVHMLTRTIGERSVRRPHNIERSAAYIQDQFEACGLPVRRQTYHIVGNRKSWTFTRRLRKSFQRNHDLPVVTLTVPFNGWIMPAVRLSDHASFWNQGYQAVMVTDTAFFRNPHYHLPSDTMDTLDFDFMTELVFSLGNFLFYDRF